MLNVLRHGEKTGLAERVTVSGEMVARWLGEELAGCPAVREVRVFGLLIGLIGCWTGLNADRSTEAVGRAATRGVVRSMIAVFAADVVMVRLIQAGVVALGLRV